MWINIWKVWLFFDKMSFKNNFCLNIYCHLDVVHSFVWFSSNVSYCSQGICKFWFFKSVFTSYVWHCNYLYLKLLGTSWRLGTASFGFSKVCLHLMCDTAVICTLSYLVHPGDLVLFLWEIKLSYNHLFKKVNEYAYILEIWINLI